MNKIYSTFYGQRVFTLAEARKLYRSVQVTKNTLQRLIKRKQIRKIKRGIYHIIPFESELYTPDSLLIASKLKKKAFFCLWTALNVHDLTESKSLTLGWTRNQTLKIFGLPYQFIRMKANFGMEERTVGNQKIQVTDLERTFLDCLNNLDEFESINQFFTIWGNASLNGSKVVEYLKHYKRRKLYHYAGYVLEKLKEMNLVTEKDFEKIQQGLSKKVYYMHIKPKDRVAKLKERFSKQTPREYSKKWKLIVVS
jgi:predicted transcriptional regulator of viral defense system